MRYCRFVYDGKAQYGLIENMAGREVIDRISDSLPQVDATGSEFRSISPINLGEARLLAAVEPSKIVCVGRNYREHASELGHEVPKEPLIFLKPPSSLLAPGGTIVRPAISKVVHHEGELGVVIGKTCRNLKPDEDVRPYILGYTCVNDVTARDLQNRENQWARAKGCDTFCPVGPVVTDEIDVWSGVSLEVRVNQELRQSGNTRDFIFPLDVVIRYIADAMTLLPGDLIATGTPKGIGPLMAGDIAEVTIEGVGTLQNPVADSQGR